MKWINAEQQVTVTIYDEEHEEHHDKIMTVEEMLDTYTNEGCPTIYSNPEQKTGKWSIKAGKYLCSVCGVGYGNAQLPYSFHCCPNCGADMRG